MPTKSSMAIYLAILALFVALATPEAHDNKLNPLIIWMDSYPLAIQDILTAALLAIALFLVLLHGSVLINRESLVVWLFIVIFALQAIHGLANYDLRDVIKDARGVLYFLALPALSQFIRSVRERERWIKLALKTVWIAPLVGTTLIVLMAFVAPGSVSTSWRIQWRTFDIAIPSLAMTLAWAIRRRRDVCSLLVLMGTMAIVSSAILISGSRGLIASFLITIGMVLFIELLGSLRLGKRVGTIRLTRRLPRTLSVLVVISLAVLSGWFFGNKALPQSLSGLIYRLDVWVQSGLGLDPFREQMWASIPHLLITSPKVLVLGSGLGQTYQYVISGQLVDFQLPAESTLIGLLIKTGVWGISAFLVLIFMNLNTLIWLVQRTLRAGILQATEECFVIGLVAYYPALLISVILGPGMWVYRVLPLYFVTSVLVTAELAQVELARSFIKTTNSIYGGSDKVCSQNQL